MIDESDITDIEPVPPCLVLFRDGHPCEEVITERLRRADKAHFTMVPPSATVFLPAVKSVGRPRTRPAKPPRIGRGQGWNRIDGLSREKILELQSQGLNARQIAERLECSRATVFKRLRLARKDDQAIAVADEANRVCPLCGGRKWTIRPVCNRCAQRQKRGTA
jgi:hypothetical protein